MTPRDALTAESRQRNDILKKRTVNSGAVSTIMSNDSFCGCKMYRNSENNY